MSTPPLRRAELVATLSVASDLGTGHPMERALRACLFALRLAEALGCDEMALADCYYVTLLRYAGCAADARHRAALFGDEIALGPEIDAVELWQLEPMLAFLHRKGFNRLPPDRLQDILATGVQRSVEAAVATCEVGQQIAVRLGLGAGVVAALGDVFERWDGGGVPGWASGEGLALPARIATFALDAELFFRLGGVGGVQALARQRSGGQYDPAIADLVLSRPSLCDALAVAEPWDAVLAAEPGPRVAFRDAEVHEALRVVADFTDLRTPWMSGHSTAVAALCDAAGGRLRLSEPERALLRRAAYVHDIGMAGVSVSIWDKPASLAADEWERVWLHPYYTERVLMRAPALAPVGRLAALHHERLDGGGYHRQCSASQISLGARVLAAAEAYQGMIEPRPHRSALTPEEAAHALRGLARNGGLDGDAVDALLSAAGHSPSRARPARPAGLSEREVEVLTLLARGRTNKEIAQALVIAPATVDHHVRHIYAKIGCSTRIAATLFAMEHRLLEAGSQE